MTEAISLNTLASLQRQPCRETDGLIFKYLNPNRTWVKFDDCWAAQCEYDPIAYDMPPEYTGSVDAALTTIPSGWILKSLSLDPRTGSYACTLVKHKGDFELEMWKPTHPYVQVSSHGWTYQHAILATALMAHDCE